MASAPRRLRARGLGAVTIALIAAVGLVAPAGAAHRNPQLHGVHVSTTRVRAGGTFSIVAKARYRVVQDYEVVFRFDPAKVSLPDETCDTGSGPQNADNPTCEYDNQLLSKTVSIGYFQVAPDASGTISVTTCARIEIAGSHEDCKERRVRVR